MLKKAYSPLRIVLKQTISSALDFIKVDNPKATKVVWIIQPDISPHTMAIPCFFP